MQLVEFSEEYIDTVAELDEECLGSEAWSKESFKLCLTKDCYYIYLLIDAGEHIGTVLFTRSLDEADISNVCIKERYRGHGAGLFMLVDAIEIMRDKGVSHFTLEVREKNIAALALYKKAGFESAGVRPGFYSNPDDNAVIMWKHY